MIKCDQLYENPQKELQRITEILLKPEDDFGELAPAVHDLYRLLVNVSGLETEQPQLQEHIYLSKGKAIGPHWAALCVCEILRTKRFIRGVFLGIQSAIAKFSKTPIHVLYAGTGPFATLAIPLITFFTSNQINFTFLEINPHSIELLKRTIHSFKAEEYVTEIIQGDALEFQADPRRPVHMIISETMQNALQKEPQVAITMNLVPQMEPDGILIPENIQIETVLVDPKRDRDRMLGLSEAAPCYRKLGTIFELNRNIRVVQPVWAPGVGCYGFPEVEVPVPGNLVAEYSQLCLFTRIRVFGEVELGYWDCSLTQPQRILQLNPGQPVNRVAFRYMLNDKPGFEHRIIAY